MISKQCLTCVADISSRGNRAKFCVACARVWHKEYKRRWRLENREKIQAYDRKYDQNNKEKRREYKRRYRQQQREA